MKNCKLNISFLKVETETSTNTYINILVAKINIFICSIDRLYYQSSTKV